MTYSKIKSNKGELEILAGIVIFIAVIVVVIVIGAGMTGLIPGLSKLLGTDRPRNLNIASSQEYFESGHEKSKNEITTVSLEQLNGEPLKFEGSVETTTEYTSEEITSMANFSPWEYFPLDDVQIRFNEDGTIEGSAVAKLEKLISFAESLGFSSEDVKAAMNEYNIPVSDLPVYTKINGSVTDNVTDMQILKVEIGRIPVPGSIVEQIQPQAVETANSLLQSFPGFYAKEMSVKNGKLFFDGTAPAKIFVANQ